MLWIPEQRLRVPKDDSTDAEGTDFFEVASQRVRKSSSSPGVPHDRSAPPVCDPSPLERCASRRSQIGSHRVRVRLGTKSG